MQAFRAVARVAMYSTALAPIAYSAAFAATVGTATVDDPIADPASPATLAEMQTQCTALALAHDTDGIGTGDIWTGEVVEGAVTLVSGPTEVDPAARVKTNINGIGIFTPGVTYIQGDPFRIGGSVNMFGDRYASSGSWSDSTYDFTNEFKSTFAHAFSCNILVENYNPPVVIPGHPVLGHYIVEPEDQGGEETSQNSCDAFTAQGPQPPNYDNTLPPWWGFDHAQCDFVVDSPATEDENEPESWDPPELFGNEPGVAVNQEQTDTLSGQESHGGPVQAEGGPYHIGQTVICISPSKTVKGGVPGAWQKHNGYTGTKCNTDWFQSKGIYAGAGAVWGSGTESSNGTYISVPNYTF